MHSVGTGGGGEVREWALRPRESSYVTPAAAEPGRCWSKGTRATACISEGRDFCRMVRSTSASASMVDALVALLGFSGQTVSLWYDSHSLVVVAMVAAVAILAIGAVLTNLLTSALRHRAWSRFPSRPRLPADADRDYPTGPSVSPPPLFSLLVPKTWPAWWDPVTCDAMALARGSFGLGPLAPWDALAAWVGASASLTFRLRIAHRMCVVTSDWQALRVIYQTRFGASLSPNGGNEGVQ